MSEIPHFIRDVANNMHSKENRKSVWSTGAAPEPPEFTVDLSEYPPIGADTANVTADNYPYVRICTLYVVMDKLVTQNEL
jgi:hypothetical protein